MTQKTIKPFHQFKHLGLHYVIDVEGMRASAIDEAAARTLSGFAAAPAARMDTLVEEQVAELGLLSDGDPKTPKESRSVPVPVVNLALFLTQSCNLRCSYCYGDGGSYGTGGKMTERTAFRAVDWLIEQSGKMKRVHLGFFGGEPFLNFPLMRKVVRYTLKKTRAAGKDVDFHATTNGTLLDEEKVA
ncbi:radical SAM protein, partial [Elusimicrobiota bacterium]